MTCIAHEMPREAEARLDDISNAPSRDICGNDDDNRSQALSSSAAPQIQNRVERPRRQWAAWTRQEEERFFNALREGGKNFQKITCQVQTKNKDQVRHYYYRLVRRINKLLAPGIHLVTKNSKDTNAAMLHWWSLLQKYSLSASKLRLKPRRFKIFIENLVQQLLKERNKSRRKRAFRENCPSVSMTESSILNMPVANDTLRVKQFPDGQNLQKIGRTKESGRKNHANSCGKKEGSSTVRSKKQKNSMDKNAEGVTAFAGLRAHQKQEKASVERVSLVSGAVENFEATIHCNHSLENGTFGLLPQKNCAVNISGELSKQQPLVEANIQPLNKFKLQLFPIDEGTRMGMEKNGNNPHLELTISLKKRISSIVGHLNQKWGKLSIASGELALFPYGVRRNSIAGHPRWTSQDFSVNAGNIYASVGSPDVFRLSYGWFSYLELQLQNISLSSSTRCLSCMPSSDHQREIAHVAISTEVEPSTPTGQIHLPATGDVDCNSIVFTSLPSVCGRASADGNGVHVDASVGVRDEIMHVMQHLGKKETPRTGNEEDTSTGDWADSISNISIGDLLSETPGVSNSCQSSPLAKGNPTYHQPVSFSCESFDAAIARFISGHHVAEKLSCCPSPKSFLNAEETCDEFLFHNVSDIKQENLKPSDISMVSFNGIIPADKNVSQSLQEDFGAENTEGNNHPDRDAGADVEFNQDLITDDKLDSGRNAALIDAYWSDSLGPLNLDISCTRSQAVDLVSSESISLSSLCLW